MEDFILFQSEDLQRKKNSFLAISRRQRLDKELGLL